MFVSENWKKKKKKKKMDLSRKHELFCCKLLNKLLSVLERKKKTSFVSIVPIWMKLEMNVLNEPLPDKSWDYLPVKKGSPVAK